MASLSLDDDDDEDESEVLGGKQCEGVALGVLCGPLEEPYLSDVRTTRAGGTPVWCSESSPLKQGETLDCQICSAQLFLVAQVYAPFNGDRALHIFGCNNPKCSNQRGSWRCIRTQYKAAVENVPVVVDKPAAVSISNDGDGDSENEWAVDEDDDEALMEQSIQQLTVSVTNSIPEAIIEPIVPHTLSSSSENKSIVRPFWEGPSFPPIWLDMIEEPCGGQMGGVSDEQVAQKIQNFIEERQKEGVEVELQASQLKSTSQKDKSSEEKYEATPNGLRSLQKFQAIVRRCPKQGLRYHWGGEPIWSSKAPPHSKKPAPCRCGSPRVFECQLMPSLLFALKVDEFGTTSAAREPRPMTTNTAKREDEDDDAEVVSVEEAKAELLSIATAAHGGAVHTTDTLGMDWGTVAIYSCAASCELSNQELVVVQDPVL